jgi:flagellin-like hook-associated protein FlgL
VRANEEAFRNALQNLAVASLDTYTVGDQNGKDRYDTMRARVTENLSLSSGKQGVDAIIADIAGAESVIGRTKERHQTHSNLLQTLVDDVQNADIYEVSSKLLDLQTRLQATYQTIGTLQGISLVNFI